MAPIYTLPVCTHSFTNKSKTLPYEKHIKTLLTSTEPQSIYVKCSFNRNRSCAASRMYQSNRYTFSSIFPCFCFSFLSFPFFIIRRYFFKNKKLGNDSALAGLYLFVPQLPYLLTIHSQAHTVISNRTYPFKKEPKTKIKIK